MPGGECCSAIAEDAVQRRGEQPAPPASALAAGEDVAGQCRRDRAVSDQDGGRVIGRIQQAGQRHEQPDLDVHIGCLRLTRDPLYEGVRHDLTSAPGVAPGANPVSVLT